MTSPVLPVPSARKFPRSLALLCCAVAAMPLMSCASTRRMVKAKPAGQSATLAQGRDLHEDAPDSGPFQKVRRTTSPAVLKSAANRPAITVLPVDLGHLKPMGKTMARMDQGKTGRDPLARNIAALAQRRFQEEANRYAIPKKGNSLTLKLAITEFTPTSPSGNVVRTAAGFFIGPLSLLGGKWTNGVIAIEGELRDPSTGRIVYQFADRESDPLTFVSFRSFKADAFAKVIVDQWAKQFAQAVHTPAGTKVKDSPVLRLNPF